MRAGSAIKHGWTFLALYLILMTLLPASSTLQAASRSIADAGPQFHPQSVRAEPIAPAASATYAASQTIFLPHIAGRWTLHTPILAAPRPQVMDAQPAMGGAVQSPNVNLTWQTVPSGQDVSRYRVYLEADDPTPDRLAAETQYPYLDPPTLALATDYYWQVVTVDRFGQEQMGPIWSFRTEDPFEPSQIGSMVFVPAGEFQMGCDEGNPQRPFYCYDREKPLRTVYLDAFEIDKVEVTNRRYQDCVEAGVCRPPRLNESHTRAWYYANPAFDHYPVLYVSWWDATDYCAWAGKRLPTEAEWEKAARGHVDTRSWPWGQERIDCTRANFNDDANPDNWLRCTGDTTPVGAHPAGASPYGALDMSGNVFEWVADVWQSDYYEDAPDANPAGPRRDTAYGAPTLFVIRGGSYRPRWFYPQTHFRKAGHHGDAPFYRNDQVGFRCARSVE